MKLDTWFGDLVNDSAYGRSIFVRHIFLTLQHMKPFEVAEMLGPGNFVSSISPFPKGAPLLMILFIFPVQLLQTQVKASTRTQSLLRRHARHLQSIESFLHDGPDIGRRHFGEVIPVRI